MDEVENIYISPTSSASPSLSSFPCIGEALVEVGKNKKSAGQSVDFCVWQVFLRAQPEQPQEQEGLPRFFLVSSSTSTTAKTAATTARVIIVGVFTVSPREEV